MDSFYRGPEATDEANAKGMAAYESAKAKAAEALSAAKAAENAAAEAGFKDPSLNAEASNKIDAWRLAHTKASKAKSKATAKPYNQIPYLIGLMVAMAIFFGIGIR